MVEEGVGQYGGVDGGCGMMGIRSDGGVRYSHASRLHWEGEEGAEFRGASGGCSATKECWEEASGDDRLDWRKVFGHIQHYALVILPFVLVQMLELEEEYLGVAARQVIHMAHSLVCS